MLTQQKIFKCKKYLKHFECWQQNSFFVLELTKLQKNQFQDDGFVIVRNVVDPEKISQIVSRYPLLFKGSFETGVSPDEFNWKFGRDDPSLTRQICNGWKSLPCHPR